MCEDAKTLRAVEFEAMGAVRKTAVLRRNMQCIYKMQKQFIYFDESIMLMKVNKHIKKEG